MGKQLAKVVCPSCGQPIVAYRAATGRILITSTAGVVLAGVGAGVGSVIGLAAGGAAMTATIPLAAIGLVLGAGAGYLVADNAVDKATCPKCKKQLHLGI